MRTNIARRARGAAFVAELSLAALVAVSPGLCAPALAQDAAAEPDAATSTDIIVTARRRDERLIDVPVSVAAVTGETLEKIGADNVVNLLGSVPGLYFSSSVVTPTRDTTYLVIRGVGANSGGEPSAATFVDGVYAPSLGFDTGFVDLERIELLRGPQGALFGRNTEAGALNIVTRRPGSQLRAKAAIEADTFETIKVLAAVSGPVGGEWSAGLSGEGMSTGGFLTNRTIGAAPGAALGGKTFGVAADNYTKTALRGGLRYKDAATELYLTTDWSRSKGNAGYPGVPRDCGCYDTFNEFQLDNVGEGWGAALNIDHDLGGARLSSITGWRELRNRGPFDFDGGPDFTGNFYDLRTRQKIYSQEFKLASTGSGPLGWTTGVYLFGEKNRQDRDFYLPDLDTFFAGIDVRSQIIDNDRKGFAIYGQGIYDLTDRLELALGLRYSRETVDNRADVDFTIPLIGFSPKFLDTPSSTFDGVSKSASLSYKLTDNLLAYASYAEGFKAGGYQKTTATLESNLPFDSERSANYEIGLKGNLIEQLLMVELSAYRVNLTQQQLQTVILVNGTIPVSAIDNAGKSHTQGFEARAVLRPSERFTLDANVGHVQTRYDRYVNEDGIDRAGDAFPFVPAWTYSVAADYNAPLSSSLNLVARAEYRHIGAYYTGTGTSVDPFFDIPANDRVNISAGIENDRWSARVFVDNVLDSYDVSYVWNAYFFAGNARNFDQVLPPRRAGVRISVNY
ncbi:Pesticin receptor precursor [Tsuneonella dongtanensis]|uniref:Pesticin receptor n=1 Tax=Tsuneonella dongtanensis TaxID=692370 RepID=A0A1B2ABN5_9SPHN|nr:TonB-dependent receptor [Tsuneonella dongtanensis]ANY19582.1 Pesticin receptor precursor [Tsuneonella dongtanensis]